MSSLHHHGEAPAPAAAGRLLDWEAAPFHQAAARSIVAVADVSGGVYAAGGLDVAALVAWTAQGHPLVEYPKGDMIDGSVLATPCGIVIPAAIDGTLTADIAARVTARLVVEGANGPSTPQAEAVLHAAGIAVVPDLLPNAGGVISSYYEWVQDHQRLAWPEADERRRVLDGMRAAGTIPPADP